ncbi:MAG: 3-methyl-2-oxobutanoate hydroxymethyltransferase [Gammaproteobacteria bacterium]|nr:3-methyl-2-oxobutanoate hydroxymethyltransferase [Gammaproteobacteria bacterium]
MSTHSLDQPVTRATLERMKHDGDKIACLTAYDATYASLVEQAGVEVIIVGDSLGMVIQGKESTLPVTLDEMIYHGACVARGARRALRVVDMPFMTYPNVREAMGNAARLMREGGAQMVKLEGGARIAEIVHDLVAQGIPVCGHLGLLPQSVHQLGGYRVQGRERETAHAMLEDARGLESAGAALLVLECVPTDLARDITRAVSMPVIGIGAGAECDGQVLVLQDMLGITPGKRPKFSRDFMTGQGSIQNAVQAYVRAVKDGSFPAAEHSF